jgi:hypothetical protein
MLEKLKAGIAEHKQEKLEKAAPAGAADQAHALEGEPSPLLSHPSVR